MEFADYASKLLIVIGIAFALLGLIAAAREEFPALKRAKAPPQGGDKPLTETVLADAAKLAQEMGKLPRWLAMVFMGIAVIVSGSALETRALQMLLCGPSGKCEPPSAANAEKPAAQGKAAPKPPGS